MAKAKLETTLKKVIKYWLPVCIWALVIFNFSSLPTIHASTVGWQDFLVKKTAHVTEYATLTILFYRALINYGVNHKKAGLYSIVFVFLYGATDEFHQIFTPGREPAVRDVLIDTSGSIIAILALWKLLQKVPKKLKDLVEMLEIV